uniref:Transposase (putative) YhgA-like domain-containing protein n=1 Tax=Candidatus Kentrum sp. MB TaxID=2138164 RepID=A0A450XGL0_9GAMM|nr:MAG: conserved hypothetical protein (putative transposase or invertase) [Candidatus Kentron sp. MB]VFK28437.1 MAG: conserved hypothetical protein (putative transposase or invertase) [Candidatus Kentron sp. MB]VFK74252.1 MAG: conserved hypothetical protein (putative transposase or invertase) [Candidatus Kentron sp. MB]
MHQRSEAKPRQFDELNPENPELTDTIQSPYPPHDRFFKALLDHSDRAETLLREHLPVGIVKCLSDKPPEPVPGSFVEKQLREQRSDRLFKVETVNGRTAFLYILIEHKSRPDRKVGWQLLKYMVEILKQWEKKNPKWKRLPAVVPFVFYHGFSKWRIPREFLALVNTEEAWRPYLLNFRFPVLDLGEIPDKQLTEDPRLYPWLLVMKYATRENQQGAVVKLLAEALRAIPGELETILYYLIKTYDYDEGTLRKIIRKAKPEEEDSMISRFAQDISQKALLQGMQQGMQEGLLKGRLEGRLEGEARGEEKGKVKMLLRLLPRRFGPLPDEISDRIYRADPNTIEIWIDRILDAKSLDEVFSE